MVACLSPAMCPISHIFQRRGHELSTEEFQKEADAVLNFLQDKLEEYVEDNDIKGGDVEQGV